MGWVGDLQPARCPIVPGPRVKVGIWGVLRRYRPPLLHGDVGGEGTGWDGGGGRWDRREGWGQRRDLIWPWSRCTAWGGVCPCRAVSGSRSHVPALTMFQRHCGKAVLPSLLSLCSCSRQPWVGCHVPRDPCPGAAEPRAEKQQLQQRALFVKMKPVCASVPVSRLACPAALS